MDLVGGRGGCVAPASRQGRFDWISVLVLVLGLGLGGPVSAATTFAADGRVVAVDLVRSAVTLEHGEIPGLLPAARSEFPVASSGLLAGVRAGERVRFTLTAADESHGLLTVASLAPEASGGAAGDRFVAIVAAILALLALLTSVAIALLVWRSLQRLHRRVVALDHETGMLRGGVTETQDGVRQIARALEEAATTFRVGYVRDLRRRLATAATSAASEARAASGVDSALVVVQRGQGELYRAVESGAVGPGCTPMWDRRRGERRSGGRHPAGHERRRGERRASPPETWTRLGFQVVPGGLAELPRGVRPLRAAGGERGAAR